MNAVPLNLQLEAYSITLSVGHVDWWSTVLLAPLSMAKKPHNWASTNAGPRFVTQFVDSWDQAGTVFVVRQSQLKNVS